jgi:hypothetical protein
MFSLRNELNPLIAERIHDGRERPVLLTGQ